MIHHGDWRDVLPGTYDSERSVVITDPPFGIGRMAYVDTVSWADHISDVLRLLPAARTVIRGPGSLVLGRDFPQARRMIVEGALFRNGGHYPGVIPYRWHAWLIWGSLTLTRRAHAPVGDWFTIDAYDDLHGGNNGRVQHDATTPYQAASWIVRLLAEPGWTVIDPYAGIGTIGQAAQAHGFDYIGAEIDDHWCTEGVMRLASGTPLELGL